MLEPEAQILGHNHRKRWNKGTNPLKLYNLSWVLSGSLEGVMEWDLVMNKVVPRSFLKSISVWQIPLWHEIQLSPIDIATGALNNRISSVIDWIFATWTGASSTQKRILRKQSWWRLLTQTWNPIGMFPNYMSGFATCSPLNITKTWLIAILKPLSGW